MKNERLSVIITSYKREIEIVDKAVSSVREQTYAPIEIIIVDDNFNDSKYSVELSNYCKINNDLVYVKQDGNKGACAARNLGIRCSKGKLIGFLDDDDTWMQEKAEKQIEVLENNTIAGLVYCKGRLIDNNYSPPRISNYYNDNTFKSMLSYNDMLRMDYVGTTSQAIVRREVFDKCGGFDEELLARQDYEMWIRISKEYPIVGAGEILFNHYIHKGEQISKNFNRTLQGYRRIFTLYKEDYKNDQIAFRNIVFNIIYASKKSGNYIAMLKFLFIMGIGRTQNLINDITTKIKQE